MPTMNANPFGQLWEPKNLQGRTSRGSLSASERFEVQQS
jgi:hypothetical protein